MAVRRWRVPVARVRGVAVDLRAAEGCAVLHATVTSTNIRDPRRVGGVLS
jgi:hypothetical protein